MLAVPNTLLTVCWAGCEGAASSWEIAVGLIEGNNKAEVVSGAGERRVLVPQRSPGVGLGAAQLWDISSTAHPPQPVPLPPLVRSWGEALDVGVLGR